MIIIAIIFMVMVTIFARAEWREFAPALREAISNPKSMEDELYPRKRR